MPKTEKLKKSSPKKKPVEKKRKKPARTKAHKRPKASSSKKIAKKPTPRARKFIIPSNGTYTGKVTHFYSHIKVGIIKATRSFRIGDMIEFKGATTNFSQKIDSMQYNHGPISSASSGMEIGILLGKRVREGDKVYIL